MQGDSFAFMCLPCPRKSSRTRYHRLASSTDSVVAVQLSLMGAPPAGSQTMARGSTQLATQHERLILELLPFKDSAKFQEWVSGSLTQGSWLEFHRDFLSRSPATTAEPDKLRVAQAAKDAINGRSQRFLVYHPDKAGWNAEDHYVRFIITVVQDGMLKSLWSESDWKKRGMDITKAVYEALCYLRTTLVVADPLPPSYTR